MRKSGVKVIFTVFLYVSVLFFIIYLMRQDYLNFAEIRFRPGLLAGSLFLLWSGFIVTALSWRKALFVHDIHVSVPTAVYSHGISVLGKYIPGKIWVILGRAFPVTPPGGKGLQRATLASLKEQLIYLFLGLLISVIPVIIFYPFGYVTVILLISLALLGLFLFVPGVHKLGSSMLRRILKKDPDLPMVNLRQLCGIGVFVILYWLIWTAGFWLFLLAVAKEAVWIQAFAFPLSVCYGVMAIIFPGGIGIRESVMTGFLVLTGMPVETAAMVSVLNRLWFITGELFIFFLALGIRPRQKAG